MTKGKVPVESYSGSLFHPDVISIFLSETHKDSFWLDIDKLSMDDVMEKAISESLTVELDLGPGARRHDRAAGDGALAPGPGRRGKRGQP